MGASLFARGQAIATVLPKSHAGGGNVLGVTSFYSVTADLSVADVFQMVKIPNQARIIGGEFRALSDSSFTFSVGDGGDTARFLPITTSVSGSQTIHNLRFTEPFKVSVTANATDQFDTIDVKLVSVKATTNLSFSLTVFYLVDGQDIEA